VVTLILALVVALGRFWLLPFLGHYLLESDGPCQADLVVVLAGDYGGARATTGADLVRRGYAPKVWVDGAVKLFGRDESELAAAFTGLPPDQVRANPMPIHSTMAEARMLAPLLRREGVRRFVLVTSDFHTRRSAFIFRRIPEMPPFCIVAASSRTFQPDEWWLHREPRELVAFEWIRTVYTWWELSGGR
jgi:uncharacterized SAM-binding protein YcdF (DUF218 family)